MAVHVGRLPNQRAYRPHGTLAKLKLQLGVRASGATELQLKPPGAARQPIKSRRPVLCTQGRRGERWAVSATGQSARRTDRATFNERIGIAPLYGKV